MPGKTSKSATQTLTVVSPKKHSVRFDADPADPSPLFTGIYLSKENTKKLLGVELAELEKAKGVSLTVSVLL